MSQIPHRRRYWLDKFANALRGLRLGISGQASFAVHFTMASAVVVAAIVMRVPRHDWCLLVICVASVLSLELMNSSVEFLGKAIDAKHNPDVGAALDIASGAVLVASLAAATVGLVVFLNRLFELVY